jgi:hypothetical protein
MDITAKWTACVEAFSKDDKQKRVLLLSVILKCADIANPGKSFEQAKYWAHLVQEEFFLQGDIEKQKGMPISPFMDRDSPALPRMQLNFIDYLVSPLFNSLSQLMPNLKVICNRLEENKLKWKSLLEEMNNPQQC